MPDPNSILQGNTQQLERVAQQMQTGAQNALNAIWKVLLAWGAEYQRRVQRVTPVDKGLARQSWFLITERTGDTMTVTLANRIKGQNGFMPYPFYLEFGTDRIAKGKVKAWQPGDTPVMSWPAKSEDLPEMPRFGTKAYERYENILTNAFASGTGEQMPMLRPIGYEIAPKVVEDVQQAALQGFQSVVSKRRGAA